MTVVIGILALIGLAVVGTIGWAFAHGVRDAAALPSSYQAGQLAGEVAASWHSAHQSARAAGAGVPASSSWAAALALGSELSLQRQEAGRAMQAAMAQVLQDNEQAVREAAASTATDRAHGTDGGDSGDNRDGASSGTVPDGVDSDGTAEGAARPTWPAHAPSRRPPRPRPRRCTQQRPARSDERQP